MSNGALYAFKAAVSTHDQDQMNSLIAMQPFKIIYEGAVVDSKTGAGVTENSLADYNLAARFTLTGVTALSRLELHLDKDGVGADVTVQIRSATFNPDGSSLGVLVKEVIVPAEFIATSAAYFSVAINLSGLTSGGTYWILASKAGDSTNKIAWIGEASADGSYPAYRRAGSSGAWTSNNALHFRIYSGKTDEDDKIIHCVWAENAALTLEYDGDDVDTAYFYLPPPDGSAGGLRQILAMTYHADGTVDEGTVTG